MQEIKFRAYYKKKFVGMIILSSMSGIIHHFGGSYDELFQFTGLRDKNRNEIYDGDVVRGIDINPDHGEYPWNGVIRWDKGRYLFYIAQSQYYNKRHMDEFIEIEVTRHIYENPEFVERLEVEKAASKNLKAAGSTK